MASRSAASAPATFADLALDPRVLDVLTELGYEEPTPVQRATIPALLGGRDVLALAATGTGKTAAFALPLLHRLTPEAAVRERLAGLILTPTRELAMQVCEAVHRYGRAMGVRALPIYGGSPMEQQVRALKRGVDVVVATPGRALDHIRRGTLALAGIRMVVLDEADEMLDMGFAEDLEAILAETPAGRQTALFSATLAPRIAALAASRMRDPLTVNIEREKVAAGEEARVRQVAYIVHRAHKLAALGRVLDVEAPKSAIVFCRTRTEVDELTGTLEGRGLRAASLHGGLSQEQRDRVMKKFRAHQLDLLVATDVAARGLDVSHVSHVVNYDVPSAAEAYVHRIGRTGRAGREGVAITFAEPREHRLLKNIERVTRQHIEIAQVPTVADMRARRLELTKASLRETILAGGLDPWRSVVESLAEEFDVMDVAAAAVRQLEPGERDAGAEPEIPDAPVRPPRRGADDDERPARGPRAGGAKGRPARRGGSGEMARLFIAGGRKAKIRPGDLVGAIVNEAGIPGSAIGSIQIADGFSIVEVPEELATSVIAALRGSTVKGRKVLVRRDRDAR